MSRSETIDEKIDSVKQQAAEWLDRFGALETEGGSLLIPDVGSTAVLVNVQSFWEDEHVLVRVFAPILIDVSSTAELHRYVGARSNDFTMGHLALSKGKDPSKVDLLFDYAVLGDELDRVELEFACRIVGGIADLLDNDLQMRFGGELWQAE